MTRSRSVINGTAGIAMLGHRIRENRGMTYAFEDFPVGRIIPLGSSTVDRGEMMEFNRRFDPQPFHLDEEAAAKSLFGKVSASGWFTASLYMRAYVDAVLADSTSLGSPGGRELSWKAPVFPGDTIDWDVEVVDARLSASRPGLGVIEATSRGRRDGELVFQCTFTGFFGTRAAATPPASAVQ